MATYVMLVRWTPQGISNIKQSPDRVAASRQAFRSMGGDLKAFYVLMGHYDMLALVEAPDDDTAAKIALSLSAQGNVKTETLRAFSEEEFRNLVTALP